MNFNVLVATLDITRTPLAEYYSNLPEGALSVWTLFDLALDDIPMLTEILSHEVNGEMDVESIQEIINNYNVVFDEVFISAGELPFKLENWLNYYCEVNDSDLTIIGDKAIEDNSYMFITMELGYFFAGGTFGGSPSNLDFPSEVYKMIPIHHNSNTSLAEKLVSGENQKAGVKWENGNPIYFNANMGNGFSIEMLEQMYREGIAVDFYELELVKHPKEVASLYRELKHIGG